MNDERSQGAWDSIRPDPDSDADMRARIDLMTEIRATIQAWDVPEATAAERMGGVPQSLMSDLMQGQIHKFTLEDLMSLAVAAGMSVEVNLKNLRDQTPNQ
jgi:predicted XRE-type DNA-binding protein